MTEPQEGEEEALVRQTWAKKWEKGKGLGRIDVSILIIVWLRLIYCNYVEYAAQIAHVVTKGRKEEFEDRSEAVYRNKAFEESKVRVKPIGTVMSKVVAHPKYVMICSYSPPV